MEYFEKTQTLCLIFGGIIFGSGLKYKFNSSAGGRWVGKLQEKSQTNAINVKCGKTLWRLICWWAVGWQAAKIIMFGIGDNMAAVLAAIHIYMTCICTLAYMTWYIRYIYVNMAYMTFYIWTYGIYGNCIWDGKCHIIMIFTYFALRASCLSLGHTLSLLLSFLALSDSEHSCQYI